jgi:DNA-binding NtrC family response regulator
MAQLILIVDDDPTQRRLIESVIKRQGFDTRACGSGREALDFLQSSDGADVRLVMLDLVMPEVDGMAVLEQLRPQRPTLPVIVLTARGGVDTVVNAMRAGADDFVVKPASPERIQVSIQNAMKLNALTGEIVRLSKRAAGSLTFDDLIARSSSMVNVIRLAKRAAQSNIPVLLQGESGVGKEIIARAIQGASDRSGKPFVTVNCGAIPENLVESILFGHEKGAFTGATEKHAGKFQEANGGTLFLDEIGELRADIQVKLLRALQEGEVDPIGAKKPVKVDVRLISATNKDLLHLTQTGDFREDLYYRLNVFPVDIPPLRDRSEDIADLIAHFIGRIAVEEGKKILGVDGEALAMLRRYNWPGNVRQLENSVFRAVVLCDSDRLTVQDFPQIAGFMGEALDPIAPRIGAGIPTGPVPEPAALREHAPADPISFPSEGILAAPPADAFGAHPLHPDDDPHGPEISAVDESGHMRTLEEIEGEMIRLAIEKYSGQMSEIARRLGIGRSTLYRKVRELGLEVRA